MNNTQKAEIIAAWTFLRENNHSISDSTLDLMKDAALNYESSQAISDLTNESFNNLLAANRINVNTISELRAENKVLREALKQVNKELTLHLKYSHMGNGYVESARETIENALEGKSLSQTEKDAVAHV